MVARKNGVRTETDPSGEVQLPAQAYWGTRTVRATENLQISKQFVNQRLVNAFVVICKCSTLTLCEAGLIENRIAQAISQAADEILAGTWTDHLIVDPLQPNVARALACNVAEILANRAAETLGGTIGKYDLVSPEQHVLLGLSLDDVFCTALRIAAVSAMSELEPALLDTERLLRRKALELDSPAFNGYGSSVQRSHRRLSDTAASLLELNLVKLSESEWPASITLRTIERVNEVVGNGRFRLADDCLRMAQISSDFVGLSGSLRELMLVIARIASDLRNSTALDAMADTVIGASYQICGADACISLCAQDSRMPIQIFANVAYSLLNASDVTVHCVRLFNQHFVRPLGTTSIPLTVSYVRMAERATITSA